VQISLKTYVQESILPRYDAFDAAHQRDHAQMVISRALDLTEFYPVDKEMIYVSAAYHDLGLVAGRENHHLVSGEILRNDARLLEWFSASQIETMAQAAEDHRASAQREPRSIYGKIIAEADRLIDPILVIERTLQYGHKHYPQLSKEEHFNRTIQHLQEKYGPQGYLKLWIPESPNAVALKELHALMADAVRLRSMMESLF
jgi:uncharacterized protein